MLLVRVSFEEVGEGRVGTYLRLRQPNRHGREEGGVRVDSGRDALLGSVLKQLPTLDTRIHVRQVYP